MGKIIRLDTAITDLTAPKLPHAVGVAGVSHRYIASHLQNTLGSTVGAWPDVVAPGPGDLIAAAAPTNTMGVDGGISYVRQTTAAAGMVTGDVLPAGIQNLTMALVMRSTATNTALAAAGPYTVQHATNGAVQVNYGTTWKAQLSVPAGWNLVIISGTAGDTWLRINGLEANLDLTAGAPGRRDVRMFQHFAAPPGPFDVAELIVWNKALTASERVKVRTALKTAYPQLA